eukprot:TRINITY_DN2839_c0_g1_i1.p1 TRINITY_DN2839_c0_g1~~TRINITY_DN2839_c0_g1_i1.p1  ORF type:complete len:620 (-),score=119.40 TRINITY_DN2839_c0_g1_i1:116-1975(-)
MIEYEFGDWGIHFIWRCNGSVILKSVKIAIPAALLSVVYKLTIFSAFLGYPLPELGGSPFTALWGGYTFILGFLLVFRTQIAYGRFWEGCSILQSVKGGWVNAVSNLIAFSTDDVKKHQEVEVFQHLLVRLMSMLFCASLQQIADMEDEAFEVLGDEGIDEESIHYLQNVPDKCEVLLQWIQRLVVNCHNTGVVNIAPPILSRVFQELSNGIIDVQGAKKIAEFLFPFPYAQIISVFLIMHWLFSPVIACILVESSVACFCVTFAMVFAVWSINYIAAEIEMPFGDDPNDLPMGELQVSFNKSLRALMDPMAQHPPKFKYNRQFHSRLAPCRSRMTFNFGQDDSTIMDMDSTMANRGSVVSEGVPVDGEDYKTLFSFSEDDSQGRSEDPDVPQAKTTEPPLTGEGNVNGLSDDTRVTAEPPAESDEQSGLVPTTLNCSTRTVMQAFNGGGSVPAPTRLPPAHPTPSASSEARGGSIPTLNGPQGVQVDGLDSIHHDTWLPTLPQPMISLAARRREDTCNDNGDKDALRTTGGGGDEGLGGPAGRSGGAAEEMSAHNNNNNSMFPGARAPGEAAEWRGKANMLDALDLPSNSQSQWQGQPGSGDAAVLQEQAVPVGAAVT